MSDTKKVILDVSYDSIDELVLNELESLRIKIADHLWNRYEDGSTPVFDVDRWDDIKILEQHRNAVDIVMSWYKAAEGKNNE